MSYLVQDRAQLPQTSEPEWEFTEIWVDPWLSPPYILILVKER